MPAILLVEDDIADQKLIKAAITATGQTIQTHSVSSAEEAIDYLTSRSARVSAQQLPDLILLDLNMPGMGGREFLKRVKADNALRQTPVIVLTSSKSDRDISDSYRLQAAGYLHKPSSLLELKELMNGVERYWFALCELPQKEQTSVD